VDRAEAGVAGPNRVAALLLEVAEERADQRRVEIVDVQFEWLFASCSCAKRSSSLNVSRYAASVCGLQLR
jgi:hypothetical protein